MTGSMTPSSGTPPPAEDRFQYRDPRGFSLLELLIVVGIILLISIIAVPSLLRSRQSANEAAAASTLQLINGAQNIYLTSTGGFGTMAQLIADGLVDDRFNAAKSGYLFEVAVAGNLLDYTATATAVSANDGRYDYYTTPDYVLRYTTTSSRAPAGKAGQPVN